MAAFGMAIIAEILNLRPIKNIGQIK